MEAAKWLSRGLTETKPTTSISVLESQLLPPGNKYRTTHPLPIRINRSITYFAAVSSLDTVA